MGYYKEASELLIRRLFGIYGTEKINPIAASCGLGVNDSGDIALPGNADEEEALRWLWEKVKTELGPVAVMGSRVTLTGFFLRTPGGMPKWMK